MEEKVKKIAPRALQKDSEKRTFPWITKKVLTNFVDNSLRLLILTTRDKRQLLGLAQCRTSGNAAKMHEEPKDRFGFTPGGTIRPCGAHSFATFPAPLPFPAAANSLAEILRLRRPERHCRMPADVQGVRL